MKDKDTTPARRTSLALASIAYAAFTAISIIGPILLERRWAKKQREQKEQ